jgi:DnaK suppressor protein
MRSTAIPATRGLPELAPPQLATLRAMLQQQRRFRLDQLTQLRRSGTEGMRQLTDADREVETSLAAGARAALRDVLDALHRMDEGSFGRCRHCDTQLPVERLEILPQVALCMPCQRAAESSRDALPKA